MNTDTVWKTVLGQLELEIAKPTFKTFFAATRIASIENNVVTISSPNTLVGATIETRYYALIKQHLDRIIGANTSLVFTVSKEVGTSTKSDTVLPLFNSTHNQEPIGDKIRQAHLNLQSTFENYAVSGSNQMAYAAATAVSKTPGTAYNPLFLWGGVGVGKTHLMHAIGHVVLQHKPRTKVIYCMGEEFTNEIVDAIQTKTTKQFKQKYRSANLLLIDDIQFIAGKNTVQEEFFHTFNTIYREGGQIVLTSDRPPHEIAKLEDRLRSRFEGGLTIDVSPPDFELRSAILRIKALQRHIVLPMDIAQLIAANITDTRKLEGTLVRLVSESEMKKLPISLDLAQSILGKQEEDYKQRHHLDPDRVIKMVAKYYSVTESMLRGSKRDKSIVYPRQILMYILRTECGQNYMNIGDFLGGRDHTTIMHGVEKITQQMLINTTLRGDIEGIKKNLSV